jgi:hypothetical protein
LLFKIAFEEKNMSMKRKHKSNYSKIRFGTVLIFSMLLITATYMYPLTAQELKTMNNPPNEPTNPVPENSSTNILITTNLSWTGGDPDGDTVTYDVYFGTTSSPPKIAANHSNTTYDPIGSLDYNTTYYWKIIAWDNQSASTSGPLWSFTTEQESNISVLITKPLEKTFYLQDTPRFNLPQRTIIYGPLNITANATATAGIAQVEFYINGELVGNDTTAPYSYEWNPIISFKGLSLSHTITVKAIDTLGQNATASINVTKWRFHILPWAMGAVISAGTLTNAVIPHTTIHGVVLNLKKTPTGWSFIALCLHYNTVGLLKTQKGVITFKKCSITKFIGPVTIKKIGPFQKTAWISFTSLGKMHITQGMTSSDFFQNLIPDNQNRC